MNLYHQVPSCKQTYLAGNLLFQEEMHLQTSDFPASYLRVPTVPQYILLRYPKDQLFDVKIAIAHPPHLTAAIGTLIDTDSRPLPLQDLLKLPVTAQCWSVRRGGGSVGFERRITQHTWLISMLTGIVSSHSRQNVLKYHPTELILNSEICNSQLSSV